MLHYASNLARTATGMGYLADLLIPLRNRSTTGLVGTGGVMTSIILSIWIFWLEVFGCIIAAVAIAETWKWKKVYVEILTVAICVSLFIGHMKIILMIFESEVALGYFISVFFDAFVTVIFLFFSFIACLLFSLSKVLQKQVLDHHRDHSI
jgi:hypothetical protein